MKRGSITVFAALCLLFTTSALLVLSEAARVWGLEQYVEWKGRQSVEYAAAEYQPYLWEQYHILSFDGGRGSTQFEAGTLTGEVMRAAESRNGRGTDLFGAELTHIYEPEYLLLTDQEGEIFMSLVTSYMKQNLPNEVLESLYEKYQKAWDTQVENPEYEDVEASIETAENGLQEAREAAEAEERLVPAVAENPLETADSMRKSMRDSLLAALLPEGAKLPTETLPVEEALENRVLEEGNSYYESSYGVQERILAAQYAGSVFPCYGREDGEQVVSCALEYLVGGKATGQENLEAVVKRLLLGRTAANDSDSVRSRENGAGLRCHNGISRFCCRPVSAQGSEDCGCGSVGISGKCAGRAGTVSRWKDRIVKRPVRVDNGAVRHRRCNFRDETGEGMCEWVDV